MARVAQAAIGLERTVRKVAVRDVVAKKAAAIVTKMNQTVIGPVGLAAPMPPLVLMLPHARNSNRRRMQNDSIELVRMPDRH